MEWVWNTKNCILSSKDAQICSVAGGLYTLLVKERKKLFVQWVTLVLFDLVLLDLVSLILFYVCLWKVTLEDVWSSNSLSSEADVLHFSVAK